MGYMCDFCGERRSMVYCRSDAAYLCLSCDRNVHSANALSKRHSRTLVCEKCNSQPAFVRCLDESLSLCQNCDWTLHTSSANSSSHNKQQINCYSGCPTSSDLSTIWSFIQDIQSEADGNSTCEQGLGLLSIEDNNAKNNSAAHADKTNDDIDFRSSEGDFQIIDGRSVWMGGSSILGQFSGQCFDQPSGSKNLSSPKEPKGMNMYGDDPLADLDMDEVDLNFENYDELFGMTLSHSEQLLENGGINSLFRGKEFSATDSNCQGAVGTEGSPGGDPNAIQPACSNAASADSGMSIKTEPIISFVPRQAQSGLSNLGPDGDSKGGDYHDDCGASPSMLLLGEPPWCPPCPETSVTSANRTNAVMRYKEKKKTRKFEKRVRYASRKARADVRKRVKGRFVKAGDAYDYDPLTPTRSF